MSTTETSHLDKSLIAKRELELARELAKVLTAHPIAGDGTEWSVDDVLYTAIGNGLLELKRRYMTEAAS